MDWKWISAVLDMLKIAEHVYIVSLTPLTGDPVLIDKLTGAKTLPFLLSIRR